MIETDRATMAHPEQVAAVAPERIALRMIDNDEVLTYGELCEDANRIGRLFAERGLEYSDNIACLLSNGPCAVKVTWAAKNSGLRYVMIGTRLNDEDIAYIVGDSEAKLLICDEVYAARVRAMDLNIPDNAIFINGSAEDGFTSLQRAISNLPATPLAERKRGASMLYSSGTTGRPKGVRSEVTDLPPEQPPHRHALVMKQYEFGADTVFFNPGPFYHAGPLRLMMAVQRAGGTVISSRKFDGEQALAAIDKYGVTHGFFVPTMFVRMLELADDVRSAYDVGTMRHAIHGAAPCSHEVKRAMIDWFGPVIEELYGGTESIGQTFINSKEWLAHPGSVGRPPDGVDVKIVDAEGNPMPHGETGHIKMRGRQRFRYHGAAADAADTYDADGYATLGDIGYVDQDGYLYLTDRQSNMIISGGVNIYPQEAENVLFDHPAVQDIAIIGVPDHDLGEVAKALVVLHEANQPDEEMAALLFEYCSKKLSRYKCPRSIEFISELPRNDLSKLVKRLIPKNLKQAPGPFLSL